MTQTKRQILRRAFLFVVLALVLAGATSTLVGWASAWQARAADLPALQEAYTQDFLMSEETAGTGSAQAGPATAAPQTSDATEEEVLELKHWTPTRRRVSAFE